MTLTRLSMVSLAVLTLLLLSTAAQLQAQQKSSADIFHQSVVGNGYKFLEKESKPGNVEVSYYSRVEGNDESKINAVVKNTKLVEVNFDTPRNKIAQPFQQAVGMAYAALLYASQPAIFNNKESFTKTVEDFAVKMAKAWEKQGTQNLTHTGIKVRAEVTNNRIRQRMWITP